MFSALPSFHTLYVLHFNRKLVQWNSLIILPIPRPLCTPKTFSDLIQIENFAEFRWFHNDACLFWIRTGCLCHYLTLTHCRYIQWWVNAQSIRSHGFPKKNTCDMWFTCHFQERDELSCSCSTISPFLWEGEIWLDLFRISSHLSSEI